MENKDIKHLGWVYDRMKCIHHENENYDYMIKFREILEGLGSPLSEKMELMGFKNLDIGTIHNDDWTVKPEIKVCPRNMLEVVKKINELVVEVNKLKEFTQNQFGVKL